MFLKIHVFNCKAQFFISLYKDIGLLQILVFFVWCVETTYKKLCILIREHILAHSVSFRPFTVKAISKPFYVIFQCPSDLGLFVKQKLAAVLCNCQQNLFLILIFPFLFKILLIMFYMVFLSSLYFLNLQPTFCVNGLTIEAACV